MRFNLLRSEMQGDGYAFEFVAETCRGEVLEGVGGKLRCLVGPLGQDLPTATRHHVGKCIVLRGATAYTVNCSVPEERWGEASSVLEAVVASFSSTTV